jgi:hypothetical protein
MKKRFLLTRSRASDYQFVGEQPDKRWWTAFSTVTNFERPSIVVEAQSTSTWRAHLTAMQSTRSDRVGTLIRYSLALEGGADDAEELRRLVAAWLAPGGRSKLAAALDVMFPEAELETWLEPDGSPDPSDVRGRLDAFFKDAEEASEFDADGEVVGGAAVRADDVKLFLHAITTISDREYDVLLVSSSRDAAGLKTDGALLDRSWMAIDREGKRYEKKKPAVEVKPGPARSVPPKPGFNLFWFIAVMIAALIALVLLVAARTSRGEGPRPPQNTNTSH